MGEIIILILIVMAIVVFMVRPFSKSASGDSTADIAPRPAPRTIRCPTCGSPAEVHGNSWECGWCGDFGQLR